MHKLPIAIIGASGYTGLEATRILANHPRVELTELTSDKWAGRSVAEKLGLMGAIGQLRYAPQDQSLALGRACAAVLLATPAEVSLALAPSLLEAGVKVVDLSGAFRLQETAHYPAFYGFPHTAPELLASAVYGLPELFREGIAAAKLLSNPGCYATAAALSVAPLLREGVIVPESIIIDAASGTTGAGRKGSEELSFSEVDEDFRAYRVLKHQHTPEIAQTLAHFSGKRVPVTFTPHLLPLKRGILTTAYARLSEGRTAADLKAAFTNVYADSPFVTIVDSPDDVSVKSVCGTNRCVIAAAVDGTGMDPGRVVVVAAIDNLVKGAAGQAVQNLNLMMGWGESEGLDVLRGFAP